MNDSSSTRLDNRVAIVTGGASGIGFETAKALKECGARVVVIDIKQLGLLLLPRILESDARPGQGEHHQHGLDVGHCLEHAAAAISL